MRDAHGQVCLQDLDAGPADEGLAQQPHDSSECHASQDPMQQRAPLTQPGGHAEANTNSLQPPVQRAALRTSAKQTKNSSTSSLCGSSSKRLRTSNRSAEQAGLQSPSGLLANVDIAALQRKQAREAGMISRQAAAPRTAGLQGHEHEMPGEPKSQGTHLSDGHALDALDRQLQLDTIVDQLLKLKGVLSR